MEIVHPYKRDMKHSELVYKNIKTRWIEWHL